MIKDGYLESRFRLVRVKGLKMILLERVKDGYYVKGLKMDSGSYLHELKG